MTRRTVRGFFLSALLVSLWFLAAANPRHEALAGEGEETLRLMSGVNARLREHAWPISLASIEFYTLGRGRPDSRVLQLPLRWVAGDPRRDAAGNDLTYLVDQSDGATTSGLRSAQTEAAIDSSLTTWDAASCLRRPALLKRADIGADPDLLDGLLGFGGIGDPFLADIVNAGWMPKGLFELVGGAGSGDFILAFTATFVFVDADGSPTDLDGDRYADMAFAEIYYNDTFGDSANPVRVGFPWGLDVGLPGIDVQSVALHENGHGLDLGHFGPPPAAVMNSSYAGMRQSLSPADWAAACTLYGAWPR